MVCCRSHAHRYQGMPRCVGRVEFRIEAVNIFPTWLCFSVSLPAIAEGGESTTSAKEMQTSRRACPPEIVFQPGIVLPLGPPSFSFLIFIPSSLACLISFPLVLGLRLVLYLQHTHRPGVLGQCSPLPHNASAHQGSRLDPHRRRPTARPHQRQRLRSTLHIWLKILQYSRPLHRC